MEPSIDDGFKWFGEGFDGFPKRPPDDTVEYLIFIFGDKLRTIADRRARLNEVLKTATDLCTSLLNDFIWQKDAFSLNLSSDRVPIVNESRTKKLKDSTLPPHLYGRTGFGESIADEWLVVFLLLEISKKCPDIYIRVFDNDGEFLLIEAANALPKWLNPEVAENRVWISNGHLRLIPLESESAPQSNLSLTDALSFIELHADKLVISPFVEDAAFARLKEYPAAIQDSLHHARITVPRKLAYILHEKPAYVTSAIEAFYLRDAVALKPLATKDISTLGFPPEDFVTVSVKFTKVSYAQLQSQVFDAPPAWIGISPKMHDKQVQNGMKLSCGFEMLLADSMNKDKKAVREIQILLEDWDSGEVTLSDAELKTWPDKQDDEKWLDISFDDFENELSEKKEKSGDVEEGTAQANLRKMVSQFQDFMNEDSAGMDGIDEDEDETDESDVSSTGEDKDGSFDDEEFEQAMKEMMGMSEQEKQDNGLLEEARKLALADGENDDESDEETKKVMEMVERELKGHGALGKSKKHDKKIDKKAAKVTFGPEVPPGFKRVGEEESADEEIGPGDEELSSDDEEYNDVDLNLARNLLQSFKGQSGASGPAGNMMRAMGINMPRDEDDGRKIG